MFAVQTAIIFVIQNFYHNISQKANKSPASKLWPPSKTGIVAAWAAGKSSPKLEQWLLSHPQFGALLKGWRERGAIPAFAKYLAGLMLASSWLLLWALGMKTVVLIALGVFFSALMTYIISRPNA